MPQLSRLILNRLNTNAISSVFFRFILIKKTPIWSGAYRFTTSVYMLSKWMETSNYGDRWSGEYCLGWEKVAGFNSRWLTAIKDGQGKIFANQWNSIIIRGKCFEWKLYNSKSVYRCLVRCDFTHTSFEWFLYVAKYFWSTIDNIVEQS